jgi:ribosomal protein S16
MVVKIRLARFGRRKAPFYNIVVAQARYALPPTYFTRHFFGGRRADISFKYRTARNSKPIEVLGSSTHHISYPSL